ncbi:hypothetical protein [Pseudomonas azotoformans]|uniref:Uncharacterized protein n=1 Tax=Pseudomonas azotoformans TaxID=47878 RepID=A0A127I5T6_PSEAZ|nr:hypothetical protein [Pseudomonas azotoformans]AMN82179.1 hypothetical protein AYR47_29425 [Pseudomonas azotoformans]
MPIDSSRYLNASTQNFHSYANKYQDIAPTSQSTTGSWTSHPSGSSYAAKDYPKLPNTKERDLDAELHLAGWATTPRTRTATVTNVKKPEDLNIAKTPNTITKFVVTRDGQMAIANISKDVAPKMISHPATAELGVGAGQSNNIVSAGYLKQTMTGRTHLSNTSGHYLPTKENMRPAQDYLEKIGVKSTKSQLGVF